MNIPLLDACERWVYQSFGTEATVWFWAAVIVTSVVVLIIGWKFTSAILTKLNNWLASPDGWRPINWRMIVWAAATLIVAGIAAQMYQADNSGWTIPLALAGLSLLAFAGLQLLELSLIRGSISVITNLGLGLLISPIIQLGALAIIVFAVLLIWSIFAPRYVVMR